MQLIKLTISLTSSLVTPLKGDTLFGQFCWGYCERYGKVELEKLLAEYTTKPNIIISDAFYHNYLPRPNYPFAKLDSLSNEHRQKLIQDRKIIKKKTLINTKYIFSDKKSLSDILRNMLDDGDFCTNIPENYKTKDSINVHNTINRFSGGTGSGEFAPYGVSVTSFSKENKFDIYILFDTNMISVDRIRQVLQDMGLFGYGADATIGMGKFILEPEIESLEVATTASSYLTLSPVVIEENMDLEKSYYNLFTRFGRTGNIASFSGNPFKKPVTMLDSGALISLKNAGVAYVGRGLDNVTTHQNNLGHKVYHQGYSIIIPLEIN